MKTLLWTVLVLGFGSGGDAHAHGAAGVERAATPAAAAQRLYGIAGSAANVVRTIEFSMSDAMRFQPAEIRVNLGDTVRIVVRNEGRQLHELVIGTLAELKEHAALMREFPDMLHEEPHMTHVSPGQSGEIVWHFNRPGRFHYACLVAGHMEAGMVGQITVSPR